MLLLLLIAIIIILIVVGILMGIWDTIFPDKWERQQREDKKLAKYEAKLNRKAVDALIRQNQYSPKQRNTAKKIAKWWLIITGICVIGLLIGNS